MQKRLALSLPLDGSTLPQQAAIAREAESLGYTDAWSLEVDGLDCFSPLALLGTNTGLRLGTAIANVYTRGPATLAMTAAGAAELAPGRFILGIGSGSQPIVEQWNGGRFAKPATRVREMAQFLRQALAGERVVFEGETIRVNGFRISRPPASPPPIYIAALRPGMLRVAGEVGDGAIINWLSAEDCRKSVAVVREAAEKAGRDPDSIEIVCRLMICVDPPSDEIDVMRRRHLNGYLNVPVYRAFHEWLGRTAELTPMWDAWANGDRRGAVAAVPANVLDDLVLWGSASERNAAVQRYHEAGVDTAVLHLISFAKEESERKARVEGAVREMG
jgi:probable F420-dependent oxidoreductase